MNIDHGKNNEVHVLQIVKQEWSSQVDNAFTDGGGKIASVM